MTSIALRFTLFFCLFSIMTRAQSKPERFETNWKRADSLADAGLPKSALEVVDKIYNRAKSTQNYPQMVKAIVHKMGYLTNNDQDAFVGVIDDLRQEIKSSPAPTASVLYSILGEVYWQFYQQNRWQFYERTTVANNTAADPRLWDARQVVRTAADAFLESVAAPELRSTQVGIFDEILVKGDAAARALRPTLYDLLAHRAIDFFGNKESDFSQPIFAFSFDNTSYLSDFEVFNNLKLQNRDSLSLKFYVLDLYQKLGKFHGKGANPDALVAVDLARLAFVRQNTNLPDRDTLYRKTLRSNTLKVGNNAAAYQFALAQNLADGGARYSPLDNPKPRLERKEAADICREIIKNHPKTPDAQRANVLLKDLLQTRLDLTIEEVNASEKPFRALVSYQNVSTVFLRVLSVSDREKVQLRNYYANDDKKDQPFITSLLTRKAVREWTQKLPEDGDLQTHRTEIKIAGLARGSYVILGSDTQKFTPLSTQFGQFQVADLAYIKKQQPSQHQFYLTNRHTGAPVAGATVEVHEVDRSGFKKRLINKYSTDNEGFIGVSSGAERTIQIVFKAGGDEITTENIYDYANGNPADVAEKTQRKTVLFTDRALYRPGQTVYFKGILFEGKNNDFRAVANQTMNVGLFDVNNEKITDLRVASNEFGSFTGTFVAPTGRLTGAMSIRCEFDGAATISVEEYKRPTFEVIFNAPQTSFKLNETVKASGKATSFSGVAVSNALVSYRVVRQAYTRPWWGDFGRMGRMGAITNEMEIANGSVRTDENGAFAVEFSALADPRVARDENPVFSFIVLTDVTNTSGETRQSTQQIRAGFGALTVETSLTGTIDGAGATRFDFRVTNLAGMPVKATTQLVIRQLNAPNRILRKRLWMHADRFVMDQKAYENDFPNDVYANEDQPESWPTGSVVWEMTLTDSTKKINIANLGTWKPSAYVLEIKTRDERGETLTEKRRFGVQNATRTEPPQRTEDWVQTIRANGEPSQKAVFMLGNAQPGWVLYECERNHKIAESRWLKTTGLPVRFEIPISETDRGGFVVHFTTVQNGRLYTNTRAVSVPFTNKMLALKTSTFRDKLQPGQAEQWKLQITGPAADKVAAELVATLYDASLDAIMPHNWPTELYSDYYAGVQSWQSGSFDNQQTRPFRNKMMELAQLRELIFDQLDGFGSAYMGYPNRSQKLHIRGAASRKNAVAQQSFADMAFAPALANARAESDVEMVQTGAQDLASPSVARPSVARPSVARPKFRKDFNETAFFFPQLQTDSTGDVTLSFTMPEALTRWRLMAFAHTKNLQIGHLEATAITQKELMVTANTPRFFRENDKIKFTAKIENLADGTLNGTSVLELFDAFTMKALQAPASLAFEVAAAQSANVAWDLQIPQEVSAIVYRLTATAGAFSDGEEKAIPVLSDRILVTETLPIWVSGPQQKTFTLAKLRAPSATLRQQSFTLEMTSNPAWYALQSLPYLMEHPNECTEQVFSRLYANALGAKIGQSNPAFRAVIANWALNAKRSASPLLNNQELKNVLIEETPWAAEARTEADRTARLAQLFDLNRIEAETQSALQQLSDMQSQTGAFTWFKTAPDDPNMTAHILAGLGKLQKLGVVFDPEKRNRIVDRALLYVDGEVIRTHEKLKKGRAKMNDNHLSYSILQYLYARSFYAQKPTPTKAGEAYAYFRKQARQHWLTLALPAQGMAALVLARAGDGETPAKILRSLKERAATSNELGTYWPQNRAGYTWQEAPVETQALMIEVFSELTATDHKTIDDLKRWLLKQKQTQAWPSTKATTEAIYALLLRGQDWTQTTPNVEVKLGKTRIDTQAETKEAGTGYFKVTYSPTAILPEMAQVSVKKTTEGPAWGGLYWQYTEKLENVTPANTSVLIKKELYLKTNGPSGPVLSVVSATTNLKVGDLVTVRVEISTDRDMDFVQIKDQRSAGFEPVGALSGYRFQNGLGYYEAPRDASTNFFFGFLPKGQHVFEYDLRATHAGDFSNGLTTLQCLYAPQFTSHSASLRVVVGK